MDRRDPLESFENEAELFYKDTGFLAPGKSESPAAIGQTDFERYEVRALMKKAWDAGRRRHDAQVAAEAVRPWRGAMNEIVAYRGALNAESLMLRVAVRLVSSKPAEPGRGL